MTRPLCIDTYLAVDKSSHISAITQTVSIPKMASSTNDIFRLSFKLPFWTHRYVWMTERTMPPRVRIPPPSNLLVIFVKNRFHVICR